MIRHARISAWMASLGASLLLTACSSAVTPATLAKVSCGMKLDQVETIFGRPTRIDESETTGVTGKVYHYSSAEGDARVVFINDTVFKTEFIPEGTHA
jgi:hypothetical protein